MLDPSYPGLVWETVFSLTGCCRKQLRSLCGQKCFILGRDGAFLVMTEQTDMAVFSGMWFPGYCDLPSKDLKTIMFFLGEV